jgi:hypothetical protein
MSELPKDELFTTHSDMCNCKQADINMDKIASVSYVAMLSVVAYGMLAISTLVLV